MTERVGRGTPCSLWSLGVREVVGSRPGRGNSKESFSSNQKTGKVFSPDEASSHVNNYAYSGKLL